MKATSSLTRLPTRIPTPEPAGTMSETRTVLVLTAAEDDTADAVVAELEKLLTSVVRIDVGDFPVRMRLAARHKGDRWRGRLWTDDVEIDLDRVGAAYYRRPTRFVLPSGLSAGDAVFATAEARLGFGGVLASLDAMWINNPAKVAIAEYKPVQLKTAADAGLDIPQTLVTNDHGALVDFAASVNGPVVCKTLSSLVLSERTVAEAIYTTPVEPAQVDPQQLATTAHLVQQWVPKVFDVRVTMVGRIPYAAAIHAGSDAAHLDWRADYPSLSYERIEPPTHVTAGMIRYLQALGLNYGAFDFVVQPDGTWRALECNPNGQWLWLEHQVGLPIAAAVAGLLAKGTDI
ncbi:MAG: ATP-grasp ribosomal peptide maturase [Pseudonocardia sp.]